MVAAPSRAQLLERLKVWKLSNKTRALLQLELENIDGCTIVLLFACSNPVQQTESFEITILTDEEWE